MHHLPLFDQAKIPDDSSLLTMFSFSLYQYMAVNWISLDFGVIFSHIRCLDHLSWALAVWSSPVHSSFYNNLLSPHFAEWGWLPHTLASLGCLYPFFFSLPPVTTETLWPQLWVGKRPTVTLRALLSGRVRCQTTPTLLEPTLPNQTPWTLDRLTFHLLISFAPGDCENINVPLVVWCALSAQTFFGPTSSEKELRIWRRRPLSFSSRNVNTVLLFDRIGAEELVLHFVSQRNLFVLLGLAPESFVLVKKIYCIWDV